MANILVVPLHDLLTWAREGEHFTYAFIRLRKRKGHVQVTVLLQESKSKKGIERYKEWRRCCMSFEQYEQFADECVRKGVTTYMEGCH